MDRKKTLTQLKTIFKEKDGKCEQIPEEEQRGYLDASNVLMVIPKTDIGKEILINNFELGEPKKIPELTYADGVKAEGGYSVAYLKIVLEFIKCFEQEEDRVVLSVKEDYPLTVELKHFKIILAPRITNMEELENE